MMFRIETQSFDYNSYEMSAESMDKFIAVLREVNPRVLFHIEVVDSDE